MLMLRRLLVFIKTRMTLEKLARALSISVADLIEEVNETEK
jgi:hypothetical protein